MFERYTEKARRVVFFSRYEASQSGSPYIEVAHLLLGVVRESFATFRLVSNADRKTIQRALEDLCSQSGEPTATSVDLPLSQASMQVLAFAAEEAKSWEHEHIGPEHVLLGALRLQGPESGVLAGLGILLETAREVFRVLPDDPATAPRMLKAGPSDPRLALTGPILQLPVDRVAAAVQIITALRSSYVTVSGESAEGSFSYSFGKALPAV